MDPTIYALGIAVSSWFFYWVKDPTEPAWPCIVASIFWPLALIAVFVRTAQWIYRIDWKGERHGN